MPMHENCEAAALKDSEVCPAHLTKFGTPDYACIQLFTRSLSKFIILIKSGTGLRILNLKCMLL